MNMLDQKIIDRLHADLQAQRRTLLGLREVAETSREDLNPPARGAEDAATRDNLRRGVAQRDRIRRERLQQIDAALLKISQGRYGLCESCGRPIAVKRLYAVPEARRCMRCASREASAAPAPGASPGVEGERDREVEQ
jgi:RNA polymerase-binding transcription factor DksA